MKNPKMLGLAAVAAVAVTAFVGGGTASATVICKTNPGSSECPAGWDYPAGTEGLASIQGTATLETVGNPPTVLDTCSGGTVKGTSQNTGGASETVKSILTALTWEGCSKTTETLAPGTGELHWIPGTNNGTVTTAGFEVTVNTIFGSCVYGAGAVGMDMGTVEGGTGSLAINAIIPRLTGPCPAESRFTATYVATKPASTAWVAER